MSEYCAELLERARSLGDLAAERSEAQLLCAAVCLELRAAVHACPGARERIAIHYLLLTEHAEVRPQLGLAKRYARRAWRWAASAELGAPSPAELQSAAHADA
ncbi:MAG: hypothetical protein ACHQ6V_01195 [Myxococcota bacterium]